MATSPAQSQIQYKLSTAKRKICDDILQYYRLNNEALLLVRLKEADAAIYNNDTSQIIIGSVGEKNHMAAYNKTSGFVDRDSEAQLLDDRPRFKTPTSDPIVVIARCTRVMLEKKTLDRMRNVAGENNESLVHWEIPKFTWVKGVPGCGKTTWIVRNFDKSRDVVITPLTEAATDLKERLRPQLGADVRTKVRTMASVLVNGFRESDGWRCHRLIIDEALMNHFGATILATKLADASETILIGDENQVPYIDRNNAFTMKYSRLSASLAPSKELLCTHRNPMDVPYALSEVYDGIYTSKFRLRSLELKSYAGTQIQKATNNTLYLTYTQCEKEKLISEGYGTGYGSRVNTIHEAQGSTFETVVIVRASQEKISLHKSIPHAVVAITRHTTSCVYYTNDNTDAIAQFILKAERATSEQIREYNIKMAIRAGDEEVAREHRDKNK